MSRTPRKGSSTRTSRPPRRSPPPPARRMIMGTWALAGAVAGFAGFALAATIGTFGPLLGFNFLLLTITATVAGGLGRPYATLGGALIVGLAIQIAGTYTSSAYELVFAFLLLVLLMLFRPNGVFVRRSSGTVRARCTGSASSPQRRASS